MSVFQVTALEQEQIARVVKGQRLRIKLHPEEKVLCAPPGVNSLTLPPRKSVSNRMPALLKASPTGVLNPEAKVLCAPPGANSRMLPAPLFRHKQISRTVKGQSNRITQPGGKVLRTPPGVNS